MSESTLQLPDRNNASTSTGPKTVEGKRRARYNATRHGIFANLVLTSEPFRESKQDFERLFEALWKTFRCDDELDRALVGSLTLEFLRLSRIYKADVQIAPQMFKRVNAELVADSPRLFTERVDKEREFTIVQKTLDPELLIRYETRVTKNIHRLLDRLEERKVARRAG